MRGIARFASIPFSPKLFRFITFTGHNRACLLPDLSSDSHRTHEDAIGTLREAAQTTDPQSKR